MYVFHCIANIAYYNNMQSLFEQVNHGVVCLAMEVIGAYVSWIDISLIASDKCMRYDTFPSHASIKSWWRNDFSYLLKYLSVDTLRESAADCLHEVVCKGINT